MPAASDLGVDDAGLDDAGLGDTFGVLGVTPGFALPPNNFLPALPSNPAPPTIAAPPRPNSLRPPPTARPPAVIRPPLMAPIAPVAILARAPPPIPKRGPTRGSAPRIPSNPNLLTLPFDTSLFNLSSSFFLGRPDFCLAVPSNHLLNFSSSSLRSRSTLSTALSLGLGLNFSTFGFC